MPWWVMVLVLLVMGTGLAMITYEEWLRPEVEDDPYHHEFNANCYWGPIQRCCEWVEGDDGEEIMCGLTRAEHEEVYSHDGEQ